MKWDRAFAFGAVLSEVQDKHAADRVRQRGPTLLPGRPFGNVQSSLGYWSATVFATFTTDAYGVSFGNGGVFTDNKNVLEFVWCVRGGQGVDTQ